MPHPHAEFEGTVLWAEVEAELAELEANGDLALATARPYVVGAPCQRLVRAGLMAMPGSDAPAA